MGLSIKVGQLCASTSVPNQHRAAAEYFAIDNEKLYVMQQHAKRCWTEQRCRLRVFTLPPGREHEQGVVPKGLTVVEEQTSKVFGACPKCRKKWLGFGCSCFAFNLRPRDRRSKDQPYHGRGMGDDDSSASDFDEIGFQSCKGRGK